jgi:hypothetical protein
LINVKKLDCSLSRADAVVEVPGGFELGGGELGGGGDEIGKACPQKSGLQPGSKLQ